MSRDVNGRRCNGSWALSAILLLVLTLSSCGGAGGSGSGSNGNNSSFPPPPPPPPAGPLQGNWYGVMAFDNGSSGTVEAAIHNSGSTLTSTGARAGFPICSGQGNLSGTVSGSTVTINISSPSSLGAPKADLSGTLNSDHSVSGTFSASVQPVPYIFNGCSHTGTFSMERQAAVTGTFSGAIQLSNGQTVHFSATLQEDDASFNQIYYTFYGFSTPGQITYSDFPCFSASGTVTGAVAGRTLHLNGALQQFNVVLDLHSADQNESSFTGTAQFLDTSGNIVNSCMTPTGTIVPLGTGLATAMTR
jgi:hypothetical protein